MKQENEFDDILDAALQEYREAEPLAGIEDRMLRRLQSHIARRPPFGWQWPVVVATLAVVVMLVWIGARHAYQHRSSPPQLVQGRMPAAPAFAEIARLPSGETHSTPEHPVHRQVSNASTRPKTQAARRPVPVLAQFPTPAPLDREERALLALAQTDPNALQPFMHDDDTPADIAPITIQPLEQSRGPEGEN